MGVPDDIAAAIDAQVEAEEGEVVKQLRTKWEERVEAEAIARSLEQGEREMALLLLQRRCGPLDDTLRERIGGIR